MKAITLWQPWAQLCVLGVKRVETRGYNTNIRGQVAIHAAKKDVTEQFLIYTPVWEKEYFYKNGIRLVAKLPRGVVVGTVEIVDCVPIEKLYGTQYDTPQERAFGDWSPGRYGWIMKEPVLFDKPVPAIGRQGFWNWEGV